MPTPVTEIIAGISNVLVALSASITAGAAAIGLSSWKEKVKGSAEYELAKQTLKRVYAVENGFRVVRNPVIWNYEYPEEYRVATMHEKNLLKQSALTHVYENRWKSLTESFDELENSMYLVRAEWGTDQANKIEKIRSCKYKLKDAINDYLESIDNHTSRDRADALTRGQNKMFETIYFDTDENSQSEFENELRKAIRSFDDWLRPYTNKH